MRKFFLIAMMVASIVSILLSSACIEQDFGNPYTSEPLLTSVPTEEAARSNNPLKDYAEDWHLYIGAAVDYKLLNDDVENPEYRKILEEQFNMLTPESAMKFENLCPDEEDLVYTKENWPSCENRPSQSIENYAFDEADYIVEFAHNNNMKIRGHTLVWHQQLPKWISDNGSVNSWGWSDWQLEQILKEYIQTVVSHFEEKGEIYAWDVVNEAIADDNAKPGEFVEVTLPITNETVKFRNTIWFQAMGFEYIEKAFWWACEADPSALLFYNDYGGEEWEIGKKADNIYKLVEYLVEKGIPIDGVGLQAHLKEDYQPDPDKIARILINYRL